MVGSTPAPVRLVSRTVAAIAAGALWVAACLLFERRAWLEGQGKAAGALLPQLVAAGPLIIWVLALRRGLAARWGRAETIALFLAAVVVRLPLLDLPPAQSDDIYRYIWEGRVQLAGRNPFAHPPADPALAELRDPLWPLINHPQHAAIYPPLAQGVFLLAAAASPTVLVFKLIFTACDLLTLVVLMDWLRRLRASPAWAVLGALHPLVIVEFSGNGHLDSLMILLTVLALARLEAGRDVQAVLALAGAVAVKFIPLLILPFFFWRLRRRWLLLLPPALLALGYLPYLSAGEGLWRSAWIYQRDWLYNAPIFEGARDLIFGGHGYRARWGFYSVLAAVTLGFWLARRPPSAAYLPVVGFYQCAGPVAHPWYLAQFMPLALVRGRLWPWLWLTVTAPLVYPDEASAAARAAVWGPFLAFLAGEGVWTLTRRRFWRAASRMEGEA